MTYDPRTETGIPTEPVGSLPRPAKLQAAYADYDAGRIGKDDLEALQDDAVRDSITPDGGDRIADRLRWRTALVKLRDLRDHGDARRHRPRRESWPRRPVLRDLRRRPQPAAPPPHGRTVPLQDIRRRDAGEVDSLREQADEAGGDRTVDARAPVPARRGDRRATRASSSRGISSTSARRTSAAPSRRGPRACRSTSPRDGSRRALTRATRGRVRGMLDHFIELNNRVLDRFSAEDRVNIGVHTCPGGDRDSVHSADVPYSDLLPSLFRAERGLFPDPARERARQGSRAAR